MNYVPRFALLLATLVALPCWANEEDSQAQQPHQLKTQIDANIKYLLYLPEDYEKKDSWPLLLFLHGAGERGDNLELVKVHGPPKLIHQGKQFPFIVVSPQCPKNQWWDTLILDALLNEMADKHRVDMDRVYVTGLSMGGFGTWSIAARFPHRFAAIAPICGGGETFWTKRFPHLPVWAFHGAKDEAVPLRRSQELVDSLNKRRANVKFTVYPEAAHDSWTETYDNPELYTWLLAHSRSPLKVSVKSEEDRIDIRSHDKTTVVWIKTGTGIGKATLHRNEMKWPERLLFRLRLRGLESFAVSNNEVKLAMSVLSHGDNMQLVHLWKGNQEGPRLSRENEFWTKIDVVDATGKGRTRIPLRDGFFEVALPKALLKDNPASLKLKWIDFYRR